MNIISVNTTWVSNQVITLSDDIQIAPGATLTIEAGATVHGNGHAIIAFGKLDVNGTSSKYANINNSQLYFGSDYNNPGRIEIDYTKFNGGSLFPATGNGVYGSFSINHSIIKDSGSSHIWYPTGDSIFSGNAFINSGGLDIGTSSGTVHIEDNVFIGSGAGYNGSATIVAWASYGEPVYVSGNSFLDTSRAALEVTYSSSKITAQNNYFGTSDPAKINSLILDRNDDLNRPSIIVFQPVADAPSPGAKAALAASGLSIILGTNNNDTLNGTAANNEIYGGAGDDYIADIGGSDTLRGGDGNDRIFISRGDNGTIENVRIEGGDGDDIVTYQNYRAGSALIDLGKGNDRLTLWTAQSGGITILLGEGRDIVTLPTLFDLPAKGAITIADFQSGTQSDKIDLTEFFSSKLSGWNGSINPFSVSAGYMRAVQSGSDTLLQIDRDAAGAAHGWTTLITLQSTNAASLTADNMSGFDPQGSASIGLTLTGSAANDMLDGGTGNDVINGGAGNDIINGYAGNDRISGGIGNDTIHSGTGNDIVEGGAGDDYITDAGGSDTLRGGDGNDQIFISRVDNNTIENVRIEGGDGDDIITYQNYRAGSVVIDLGKGNDKLTLWTAQSEGTTILLGEGQDVVTLSGLFDLPAKGPITIADFQSGAQGDKINLTEFLSNKLSGWNGTVNPFSASAGYMRALQVGSDTLLQVDKDAAGTAHGWTTLMTLQSTNAASLTADNMSGWAPRAVSVRDIMSAAVTAPTIVTEGTNGSFSLSVTLKNVASASGTISMTMLPSSTAGASDVSGLSFTQSYSVTQSPARDYVITAPAITIFDDLVIERDKTIDIQIKATGQIFDTGTDTKIVRIALADGDRAGTSGNDELFGTAGKDLLEGGLGNDIYHVNHVEDVVKESANAGIDTVYSQISYTLGTNVENLVLQGRNALNGTGNTLANILTGNSANNILLGGAGDDRIVAGGGRDIVDGGSGLDMLVLGNVRDTYAVFTIGRDNYLINHEQGVRVTNVESVQFADETASWASIMQSAKPFDATRYILANPDLAGLAGDPNGTGTHFASFGFLEGREARSFDTLQYVASSFDLIRVFGTDEKAAMDHYVGYGIKEGRPTNAFDALRYIASNDDLIQAFGTDTTAALQHYISYGFSEARQTRSFDAVNYVASNPDLIRVFGNDTDEAQRHYIKYGSNEGRDTDDFNALEYIASNPDLIQGLGTNADAGQRHYVNFGFNEGRQTDSFDALEYIASHTDLIRAFGTDTKAAEQHYIRYGFGEGRPTDSFDVDAYQAAHPNLAGLSDDAVLTHYISMMYDAPAGLHMV